MIVFILKLQSQHAKNEIIHLNNCPIFSYIKELFLIRIINILVTIRTIKIAFPEFVLIFNNFVKTN